MIKVLPWTNFLETLIKNRQLWLLLKEMPSERICIFNILSYFFSTEPIYSESHVCHSFTVF